MSSCNLLLSTRSLACNTGLRTGAVLVLVLVLDPRPESHGLKPEIQRLKRKVDAGAQFAITQPFYDEAGADELSRATLDVGIPIIMGILPLRTPHHAEFLHQKVSGITVPKQVRERMNRAQRSSNSACLRVG